MSEPIIEMSAPRARDWSSAALVAVIAVFLLFNLVAASLITTTGDDALLGCLFFGVWMFEPMILGVWIAIGPGCWITRLLMAIPCLLLVLVAPGVSPNRDMELREFVAMLIAGFTICAAVAVVFLVIRWRTRFRILPGGAEHAEQQASLRFSIKYLLVLTLFCAIVLATFTRLRFQTEPPPPSFLSGFNFFIAILVIGGLTLAALVLPTLAVPLMILHRRPSRRVMHWAVALWAVVTLSLTTFWTMEAEGPWPIVAGYMLVVQLGPSLVGIFTGFLLQRAGWRLIRYESGNSRSQIFSPAPSP